MLKVILVGVLIFGTIIGLIIIFGLNGVMTEGVTVATSAPDISNFDGTTELVTFMPILIPAIFLLIAGLGIWAVIKGKQ
jgi:hypothetical protein